MNLSTKTDRLEAHPTLAFATSTDEKSALSSLVGSHDLGNDIVRAHSYRPAARMSDVKDSRSHLVKVGRWLRSTATLGGYSLRPGPAR